MKPLLLILLASGAWAQEQVFPLPAFTEGLYTRYSANVIPDGALSDALNVTLDEDVNGVVVARRGHTKYNTTAITASQTVRGLWKFDATDGTKYIVAFSSASFYKSSGDGTWTAITGLNSFSLTADFQCTQTIGKLWCANGDTVFSWDGTSTATITTAPLGNLIGHFRNRVLIAGISGSKGRVRGSGELDGTDHTVQVPGVSTTPISIAFGGADDGQDVTCLMGAYQDVYLVGKRNSLWGLYGFGRNDFQVRELSREVGCIEPRSVAEKNNCLYWMSLRGMERFCGTQIERVSDPIRDKLDTIVATAGNARSALDTTQTDFEAGNLTASGNGAPMSATISPGSVVPSTFSIDVTDFANGTSVGVSTASGHVSLNLSSSTSQLNYTWTTKLTDCTASASLYRTSATVEASGCPGSQAVANAFSTYTLLSGTFSFTTRWGSTTNGVQSCAFYFILNSSATTSSELGTGSNGYYVYYGDTIASGIYKGHGSSGTKLLTVNTSEDTDIDWLISRSPSGSFSVTGNGVNYGSFTDTTYTSPNFIAVTAYSQFGGGSSSCRFTFNSYVSSAIATSGTFTSESYSMGISTPIWGNFSATVSSNSTAGIQFSSVTLQIQTSSNNSTWSNQSPLTIGAKPSIVGGPYMRIVSSFSYIPTLISTSPNGSVEAIVAPTLSNISLSASTTGYFISQCRNPGTSITAWGLFSCTQELNDGGLTYYVSTGANCNQATRSTNTWTTQTNNTNISIATAASVAYRVLFDIDTASEAPKLKDCTFNWEQGESRPPVASGVYRDRYYLAYTSSTAGGGNDHILVLDKNDKWTLFDGHSCYSMVDYERKLYCGASTSSGQVWLMDNGTDDDGTVITSRIRTKAFNFGMPERRKSYRNLYLDLEPSPESDQTITLTGRYTLERSTVTYSLGTVDLNEDPGSIMTSKFPFALSNHTDGRYLQLEIESSGLNSPWRLFGGRLYYTPLPEPE